MKCPSHDTIIKNTGASVMSELCGTCIVEMCAAFVLFKNTGFFWEKMVLKHRELLQIKHK